MSTQRLSDLALHDRALVDHVAQQLPSDPIADRLRSLGFVNGEPVRVTARGPLGGSPLLVAIGSTRFALRIQEADRVIVIREVKNG
nr:FeoA family protein [Achromobacter ruhlandii]